MSRSRVVAILDRFHHQFYGPESGRPWVFLHGLMGFLNNWRPVVAGLESTERCLAYDQRGHGRSFRPASGYAPENFADDLLEIINELGWRKIVLVGHSMGGRNGLNFCARFPERVEKFVLEDIGPDPRGANEDYYRTLLGTVPTPFPNRMEARAFFQGAFQKRAQARGNVETLAAFLNANLTEQPDGTVSWRFSPDAIFACVREGMSRDRWDEVDALKVPTLLVRGERSEELSQETYEKMLRSNPVIQGVIVPGAGHWVHSEQPARFLHEIRRFTGLEF